MRSWVSSAPPKIGRMSQSSRASKPSKSCEHSCQTQSNTIVEYNRTQLSNCSVFWELPPLLIDRIFLEHSWKTFAPPLHWRLVAVFEIYYYEKVEAGSIEGVAFILSSFISRRKSNVGSVSRSTWVQLHLLLEMERKWPLGTNWKITSQLRSKSKSQIQYNLSLNYLFQEPIHLQFTVETVTVYGFWTTGRSQSQSLKLPKTLKVIKSLAHIADEGES